jgi:formylglycine-generating enzyme required for sulfatase activity
MKRHSAEKRAPAAILAILALASAMLGPRALAPAVALAAAADAGDDTAEMKLIPAGPFTMGADRGGQEDEHPAHVVTLAAFWLDTTEVTNEAYERCVEAKVCRPHDPASSLVNKFGGDEAFRRARQPISSVSWDDATTYCRWKGKRLPREAEWEKAARGTDGRRYPWGEETPDRDRAVFATDRTADVGTHPKGAGPYGHLDMAGNVWEWLEDFYDPYAYRRPTAEQGVGGTCEQIMAAQDELRRKGQQGFTGSNPIPTECERVLRGGAFNYDGPGLRSSNRVHHPQRFRLIMSGFRCAKDA